MTASPLVKAVLGTVLLLSVSASSDVAARDMPRISAPVSVQTPATNQRPTTPPAPSATPGRSGQPGQPDRPKPWWQDDARKKELGLTPKQAKDIDQIYEANRAKMTQLSTEWHQLETELDKLIREGQVDEKVISLKLDLVEASRTQFNKTLTLMLYRMYRVLTPEQNTKLQAIRDKMHEGRGGAAIH